MRSLDAPAQLIRADTDQAAVANWLDGFKHSPHTLRAYRKESARFLFWCEAVAGNKAFSTLVHDDIVAYSRFLEKPPARYVGPPRPRSNPAWRPLAGPLSPAAVTAALGILRGMFDWLVTARYLTANPIALVRYQAKAAEPPNKAALRAFPPEAMEAVRRWLAGLPELTEADGLRKLRGIALTELLIGAGLRRSEAASARTSHMRTDRRGDFWLEVPRGKGNKHGTVVIRPETVQAILQLYRAMGQPGTLPALQHADLPLIPAIRHQATPAGKRLPVPRGLSGDSIYSEIKWIVSSTAHMLKNEGLEELADTVTRASPHWFRHGFVTEMVDRAGIRVARQQARHARMDTTLLYDHQPDYDRADAVLGDRSDTLDQITPPSPESS